MFPGLQWRIHVNVLQDDDEVCFVLDQQNWI